MAIGVRVCLTKLCGVSLPFGKGPLLNRAKKVWGTVSWRVHIDAISVPYGQGVRANEGPRHRGTEVKRSWGRMSGKEGGHLPLESLVRWGINESQFAGWSSR